MLSLFLKPFDRRLSNWLARGVRTTWRETRKQRVGALGILIHLDRIGTLRGAADYA